MSDFCPCCDDFSMDSLRAGKKPMKKSVNKKANKIVINVDNSDENADWIKHVRKEKVDSSNKDLNKERGV